MLIWNFITCTLSYMMVSGAAADDNDVEEDEDDYEKQVVLAVIIVAGMILMTFFKEVTFGYFALLLNPEIYNRVYHFLY